MPRTRKQRNPIEQIFEGITFGLVPLGSLKGKARRDIIRNRLLERGAEESQNPQILIGTRDASTEHLRKSIPDGFQGNIIDSAWVSDSVSSNMQLRSDPYVIDITEREPQRGEKRVSETRELPTPRKSHRTINEHPNEKLANMFAELADMAGASPGRRDTFRALAYRKAADVVNELREPLRAEDDAEKLRSRLGPKTVDKIKEYIRTGKIEKMEIIRKEDPDAIARNTLAGIWGVGPKVAADLVRQGYDTIERLRESGQDLLNENQKTGLKYYEELLPKMPREEVAEIADFVDGVRQKMFGDDLEMIVAGSYRRGAKYCSDADLLYSWKLGAKELQPDETLRRLLVELQKTDFIVDHFNKKNHHMVFLGICRVAPGRQARRFDMKVWPRESLACALLHFTGNADFNRRLRLYAKRHGFKLSDLGLTRADGKVIKFEDERRIFDALGLDYMDPSERTSAVQFKSVEGKAVSEWAAESALKSVTSASE